MWKIIKWIFSYLQKKRIVIWYMHKDTKIPKWRLWLTPYDKLAATYYHHLYETYLSFTPLRPLENPSNEEGSDSE